jgi:hypothetical protein
MVVVVVMMVVMAHLTTRRRTARSTRTTLLAFCEALANADTQRVVVVRGAAAADCSHLRYLQSSFA